ncbi:unnamed protein product [Pseudo-nitzschia multistriata]|uniref:Thioredoxin domain-containing protein n=1 Tax=Pseudo-nitzschia multistriata TaxID=183589 RepID=A0A448ZCA5_9STRA|nr:unnamed protein product [Pseudo-nitzschia multistriata]
MRRSSAVSQCKPRGPSIDHGLRLGICALLVASLAVPASGWSLNHSHSHQHRHRIGLANRRSANPADASPAALFLSADTESTGGEEQLATMIKEVSGMRVSELKAELGERGVDFSDCFDKESMVEKLASARVNGVGEDDNDYEHQSGESGENTGDAAAVDADTPQDFDREAALRELKGMRVRELREELGRRRIPRAGLFEKEDLVAALLEARALASVFCATGSLVAGEVTEVSEDVARREIGFGGGPPLLLDVYATWCGPCQMIAPFLKEIAAEKGTGLRIAKMDSDQNPGLSSELRVQGLPTLVLFRSGEEVDRIEGAPTKEQLLAWIDGHR